MNTLIYFIISAALLSVIGMIGVGISNRSPALVQHECFIAAFMATTMYGQYYLFGYYI